MKKVKHVSEELQAILYLALLYGVIYVLLGISQPKS